MQIIRRHCLNFCTLFGQTLQTFLATVDLSGCHGSECADNAHCDRSGNVPTCRCNQGYQGNGLSCAGKSEQRNNLLFFYSNTVKRCPLPDYPSKSSRLVGAMVTVLGQPLTKIEKNGL